MRIPAIQLYWYVYPRSKGSQEDVDEAGRLVAHGRRSPQDGQIKVAKEIGPEAKTSVGFRISPLLVSPFNTTPEDTPAR